MGAIEWHVADMLDLPYADGSFNAVIEKGTMDVLFVDNDSPWSPRPEVCARVHRMLAETHRCASGFFGQLLLGALHCIALQLLFLCHGKILHTHALHLPCSYTSTHR